MANIGEKLPDAALDSFQDGKIGKVALPDYKGKWVVLFFYPADFTFVCPTELQELAESYEKFKAMGAEILSVSTDTAFVHKAWHESSPAVRKVKFPMLSDAGGRLAKELGVYLEGEGVALRATFLADPDGVIRALEIHDNRIGRSAAELLRKLEAAKFVREHVGMVCPASWKPGKDALKG